jgi:hypothetical protein
LKIARAPSGDQTSWRSTPGSVVNRVGTPRRTSKIHTSVFVPLASDRLTDTKRPSGDICRSR